MEWRPIKTAPKDRDILVWYDHDADPYFARNGTGRLTDYGANAESGLHLIGKGYTIAKWMEPSFEATDEYGSGYWLPGGWFSAGDDRDYERVCNATHWTPIEPPKGHE